MKLVLILIHVSICLALILIVLLQKGKGANMGAVFGGSSQTVFGSGGATSFLHKATTYIAILFMFTSLGLSFFFGRGISESIMENLNPAATQSPIAEQDVPNQTGEPADKK